MGGNNMSEKPEKGRLSLTLARPIRDDLNRLVEAGLYLDEQDAMRDFIRHGLQTYGLAQLMTPEPPEDPR